ncbi:GAF domain-containing sensor histidine kinase [Myxacorys almedinensis]|uniref:histidine kinase n=1 Tax=Myxacorys almedinensis A TaxID=2690445 RepID=A0A8J7Z438_9CYAN|nr:GAF domain-containing sensor histidine kinase [Myxacorys almedinensis]NDJ17768.1 GAF domain-containing protein [Myxacorys almedinensis A]
MGIPESRLFCRLDGLTVAAREQQRLSVLTGLGLLDTQNVPIFEEATQTAAHFLNAPICLLTLMDQERQWFKSAVGLSRLGLMNDLALSRQMPREESFCINVVDSHQVLAIDNALAHPTFTNSLLVQYGIRAYLGAPLITTSGECVGTLAIFDLMPRNFTEKDAEVLMLLARLSMSEYERLCILKTQANEVAAQTSKNPLLALPTTPIRFELLAQLTQELRTPLTSVMGMASVLNREIYGPLTSKQKEYLDIIHHSGQYLLSLVKEILELSQLDDSSKALTLSPIDVEMLCQQAISALDQAAHRREQNIRLSVEPGTRIWLLDKDKVRQMIYHLIFSVIQASNAGSIIRLHVSHKSSGLRLTVWASHPCLGDGLVYTEVYSSQVAPSLMSLEYGGYVGENGTATRDRTDTVTMPMSAIADSDVDVLGAEALRKNLGLLLSRQLAELHGGQILIQGSSEPGFRYIITLPKLSQNPSLTL